MRYVSGMWLVALGLSTAGCATVFNGTTTDIKIVSEPAQASFTITSAGGNGVTSTKGVEEVTGTTPAKVNLSNRSEYQLTVKLEGYEEAKVRIRQSVNNWLICSALCGLVPAGVDVLTGGMWNLEPGEIAVTLKRAAPAQWPPGGQPYPYPYPYPYPGAAPPPGGQPYPYPGPAPTPPPGGPPYPYGPAPTWVPPPGAAPAPPPGASWAPVGEPQPEGERLFLVVFRKGPDGQMMQLVVPMIPEQT
jgi:hypothetical protein